MLHNICEQTIDGRTKSSSVKASVLTIIRAARSSSVEMSMQYWLRASSFSSVELSMLMNALRRNLSGLGRESRRILVIFVYITWS